MNSDLLKKDSFKERAQYCHPVATSKISCTSDFYQAHTHMQWY